MEFLSANYLDDEAWGRSQGVEQISLQFIYLGTIGRLLDDLQDGFMRSLKGVEG
jgi:hypothetical protein